MDFVWIAATILIAVLMHFTMPAVFNLLRWIYQKGREYMVGVRRREYMEGKENTEGVREREIIEGVTGREHLEEMTGKEYMEEVEDTEPLPRSGHLAITFGSKVFVWGGEGSTPEDRRFLRLFDMRTKKWLKRRTKGSPPQGYVACAYTLIGNVLYVFGGSDGGAFYNDIYQVELDMKTLEWKKCKVRNPGQAPMKKRSTGMIARKTKDGNELVVFGGYGAQCSDTLPGNAIHRTNEVHTFNIKKGEWSAQYVGAQIPVLEWDSFTLTKIDDSHAVVFAGVQQGPGAVNDVYCLDMKQSLTTKDPEWSWVRVTTTGEKGVGVPAARRDHATILLEGSPKNIQLFITGGIDRNWHSLNDAWILKLDEGIRQGSWYKCVSRHQDLQLKVANEAADSDADKTEHLTPRYSLTANKCESNGSEQHFHLMLFGGMSDDSMIADTTLVDLEQKTMALTVYRP